MKDRGMMLLAVLLWFLVLVPTAFANEPGGCPPDYSTWPRTYTANGLPNYDGCWTKSAPNISVASSYTSCNVWRSYWTWSGTGGSYIAQTWVIDSTDTVKRFRVSYSTDFADSYLDPYDNVLVQIDDVTAGVNLGYDYFNGSGGNLSCADRVFYATSASSLAGHTIKIMITVRRAHADGLTVRIYGITVAYNA